MTDWRSNGETLRAHWHRKLSEGLAREMPGVKELVLSLPEPMPGRVWIAGKRRQDVNPEFLDALDGSNEHDATPLKTYLESDKLFGPQERKMLAKFLPKPAQTGRPKNLQLRGAAVLARHFYKNWREINRHLGTTDHGHCEDMKMYAAEAMAQDYFSYDDDMQPRGAEEAEDFARQVRELMDKSKSRLDGADKGIITIPLKSAKTTG